MRDSTPSLVLFVISVMLVMVAKIFAFDQMMLLVKPMVIPAIYYYYLQTKRRKKTNLLFSVAIWLFFVADMIIILYANRGIVPIMYCCIISYLILIKFAIDDCKKIKVNSLNIIIITLLLFLLSYGVYSILTLSMDGIMMNFPLFLLYGFILIAIATIAVINYLSDSSTSFFFYCIMALCMIVSDFFFCIHRYMLDLPVIDHINLFAQFVSYFFMVKYFNSRKWVSIKNKEIKNVA